MQLQKRLTGLKLLIIDELGFVPLSKTGAELLFTKSTAIQYAKDNIRANSVHPGIIETDMTLPTILTDDEARKGRIARTPIGRIGQPDDVAYGVLFLASDESSFMTGSELVIDGGRTAQ